MIAPGVSAGLDWLARSTAKLPRVELAPPPEVIGPHASSVDRVEPLLTLEGLGIAGAYLER